MALVILTPHPSPYIPPNLASNPTHRSLSHILDFLLGFVIQ